MRYPLQSIPTVIYTRRKWKLRGKPVVHVQTDASQISCKHPAILVLVRKISHLPAAFMIHHNERTTFFRWVVGAVQLDRDLVTITHLDAQKRLGHFRDRCGNWLKSPALSEEAGAMTNKAEML